MALILPISTLEVSVLCLCFRGIRLPRLTNLLTEELNARISENLDCLVLTWLLAGSVRADLTGDIQGTVIDSSGAVVAGAKITIKNRSNGATRVVYPGDSGDFSAPQLEIGDYQITVEKDGFKSFNQDVVVRSGEKTRVDVHMEIGKVNETVVVESGAIPTLDVATAQVSDSISSQEALALPNQARDPVAYATLSHPAPCRLPKTTPSSAPAASIPTARAAAPTTLPSTA